MKEISTYKSDIYIKNFQDFNNNRQDSIYALDQNKVQ